ncbi:MAG TPA: SGNH/GDSL hydrolase family protein [Mycobacteriales bacterium]|nr:SGNH/GDSL hydrolase family protein [Mycobacteriales bacterium]
MQAIDLATLPVVGALDVAASADGVSFRRVPAWAWPQVADAGHRVVAAVPAGVRLEFATASRSLELDVQLTSFGGAKPETIPVFDLLVDGVLTVSRVVEQADFARIEVSERLAAFVGAAQTVRFDELPGDPGLPVELWLPHNATVELRGVRIDDGAQLAPLRRARKRWVHYGSSISHCINAPGPTATWPSAVALRADVDLLHLGLAGNCMIDHHVARTIRNEPVDFVSLKLGINIINGDTLRERTFVPVVHGFLDTIRDGHPETPLVVASPIICLVAEDHPGPTLVASDGAAYVVPRDGDLATGALSLRRVRELLAEIVSVRRETDPNLHLVDGLSLFGPDDVDYLEDGLHPSPVGNGRIAERFYDLTFRDGPFAG